MNKPALSIDVGDGSGASLSRGAAAPSVRSWTIVLERVEVAELGLPDLKAELAAAVTRATGKCWTPTFTTVSTSVYEHYLGLARAPMLRELREGVPAHVALRPRHQGPRMHA